MENIKNYIKKLTSKHNTTSEYDIGSDFKNMNDDTILFDNFDLPISYLDKTSIHKLDDTIKSDLELVISPNKPIYHCLLQPSCEFANDLIPKWSQSYTSNILFLCDSQSVIENMEEYEKTIKNNNIGSQSSNIDDKELKKCWKSIKNDPHFIERYNYLEWNMLKHLNEQDSFLLSMSYLHVLSPIFSLIMPIILLIIPFFLIKLQGYSITLSTYFNVLKDIAKHHFIGKMLSSCDGLSAKTFGYIIVSIVFYFMQIYQNIVSLTRFHRNMKEINQQLFCIKNYLDHTILSMNTFLKINSKLNNYIDFCENMNNHMIVLEDIKQMLSNIEPFSLSIRQLNKSGYILMCYYNLYNNTNYGDSLKYSFGFRGYIESIYGIYKNFILGNVNNCVFDLSGITQFKGQYYAPFYQDKKIIYNDCDLKNNIILTGVNASGKTTYLKSSFINILFSQQFGLGFYKSGNINPYTHLHSYLNIPDTSGRDSLFQAESRRCKEIIDSILYSGENSRHFCMFDELYSGTNPIEATQSSYGFLKYLNKYNNVNFILTTHYIELCKKIENSKETIVNYRTIVKEDKTNGGFIYKYKIEYGICKLQGAIEILKTMDYPEEILDYIDNYNKDDSNAE
jgi:hypothetical protein